MVLDVPGLQHAAGLGVVVDVNNHGLLAEHVFSANHQVDLSKAMVIDVHNHTQTRCMLESWHIQHHQSPLNRLVQRIDRYESS